MRSQHDKVAQTVSNVVDVDQDARSTHLRFKGAVLVLAKELGGSFEPLNTQFRILGGQLSTTHRHHRE
jgi:hypothetical protein